MGAEQRKHRIRIAFAGILFLLLIPLSGFAERILNASCPSVSGETVTSRTGNFGMILSLPGFWDLKKTELTLNGYETFCIGEDRLEAGAGIVTDLTGLTDRKVPLFDAKKRSLGTVTIRQGSAVPALFLHVNKGRLSEANRDKKKAITEGQAVYAEADGTVTYDGELTQLKGHGNNTFAYNKKPYQLKLKKKAGLSGMAPAKTWILLANWNDISLVRNQVVLDVSREAGLPHALSCVQVDVWINGLYNGLYLLTEKVQIGKSRLPLTDLEEKTEKLNEKAPGTGGFVRKKLPGMELVRCYEVEVNPEDITGGYIAVVEKYHRLRDDRIAGFKTQEGLNIAIKEPTCPSVEQTAYFSARIREMQLALMAEDGVNPETGKHYTEYLDLHSFALKFLIEEWCENYDYLGGSQYLYKDSDLVDPLIYAGPAWDYDLSFGIMANLGVYPTENHLTRKKTDGNIWWLLYRHEDFRSEVKRLWQESFRPVLAVLTGEKDAEEGSAVLTLDSYLEAIAASAKMNYARWGIRSKAGTIVSSGGSFEGAGEYLKEWIRERVAYLDGIYGR